MNKEQRARLAGALGKLVPAREAIEASYEIIEELLEDEQEKLDNLPPALAEGGPGQDLEAAVEVLETLKELLETAVDLLNEAAAKDLP